MKFANWFKKGAGAPCRVAVQVAADGVAVVALARPEQAAVLAEGATPGVALEPQMPTPDAAVADEAMPDLDLDLSGDPVVETLADVRECVFLAAPDASARRTALKNLVAEADLRGARVTLVLGTEDYRVALVDRPEVADAELAEAVRWRLQDELPFPVAEAVVDAVAMPEEVTRGRAMVMAVAAHRPALAAQVALVEGAGLVVDTIDVAELALRNLVEQAVDCDGQNVALLHLQGPGNGLTAVTRAGALLFSRRLDRVDSPDDLVLQVQRSLDYCESQLRQAQPALLCTVLPDDSRDDMVNDLREMLPVPVTELAETVRGVLAFAAEPKALERCLLALGGALRAPAAGAA